ncbi:MAG: hypothetical protein NTU81_01880 [Candidatus Nomurabacteria bacterium]|nr:hypothetical protein [Candidatus Nomurabacteria bacterium]
MDYNQISNFLEKFKKLINQKEDTKNIVIKTISEEIRHPIDSDQIKLKGGCIYIQGSPILRSEIMIHKKQILSKLKDILVDIYFTDIK